MNFNWDDDTIRWYQEANAYTDFFTNVAQVISPALEKETHLCDVGCGLGLVDLALRKKVKAITAIDSNEKVIASLKGQIKKKEITNIETKVMDYQQMTGNYDVILLSFFASRDLDFFLDHCRKLIVLVDQKTKIKPFIDGTRSHRRNTESRLVESLVKNNHDYLVKRATFEFGQPLGSRAEADRYMEKTYPKAQAHQRSSYLEEELLENDDHTYPYYLAREKALSIFEIAGRRK